MGYLLVVVATVYVIALIPEEKRNSMLKKIKFWQNESVKKMFSE